MIRCDDRFRCLRVFEMIAFLVFWCLVTVESTRVERDQKPPQPPVEWQGYSVAFHLLLPVAGFLLLWGQRDLFNKLLLQVDRRCLSVFCPSFSKRQKLLKWAVENLPSTWSSSSKTLSGGIPDLWTDGSLLCTLINMAVPGACRNPPKHWKKPPMHAQALAYKYLSITPVFQESDFKEPLSANQERKFLLYLQDLQTAIKSRSYKDACPKFSQNYMAKGMGLHNGEQYKKTTFYVYSNTNHLNCSNVLVYIRGPYDTQGTATIPAFYNLASLSALNYQHKQYSVADKIVFKKEARKSFLKSIALDFSSLVNFDRRTTTNDIPIHVEMETERAKVSYIPLNFGIYEVNLITNGELLINSPFSVSVSENDSGTRDSFDTTEKILQELPTLKRRKIVAKFIDCISEKILLNFDSGATFSTSDESRHSHFSPDDLKEEDEHETSDKFDEEVDKSADKNAEKLLPTLISPEQPEKILEEFEASSVESDTNSKNDVCDLKSPNIVRICDVEPETPIDSLEIYENLQNSAENPNINVADSVNPSGFNANSESNMHTDLFMNLNEESHYVAAEVENATDISNPELDASTTEERVQKRPTSIVTPFLVTPNSIEKSNKENYEESTIEGDETKDNDNTDEKYNSENKGDIPYNPRKLILLRNNIKNSYVERLKAILVSKLTESENTKTIKNLVNTSNKLNSTNKTLYQQDENNNSFDGASLRVTSPICADHIAPEVEEETMSVSVSEKRKLFTRQTCLSPRSSNNSSFSEKENGDVAKELSEKCSLRLLSVIDTIRNSTNSSLSRSISSSTPNISRSNSDGSKESRSSFIETREYWLSLSNGSISSNATIFHKNIHSKPRKIENSNFQFSYDKYRSAEDISSIARMNFNRKLKKYSSLNAEDFKAMEFMSLEERKKMLLQDKYEEEKMGTRFVKRNLFIRMKNTVIGGENQKERGEIRNLSNDIEKKILSRSVQEVNIPTEPNIPGEKKSEELKHTSQFKRAITFFKNLEKSSYNKKKIPLKPKPDIKRRYSLDIMEKKKDKHNVGGSLRLPKTSEKFSVARIYFDIIENKKGSFRGVPNRTALSESLASLSTRTKEILDKSDDPIELGIFNKVKPRKRKSLKSIFNIHY